MSCSQQTRFHDNIQDLEDLIKNNASFDQINKNYDTYKQIVYDIYEWVQENGSTPRVKTHFNNYFQKFQRKYRVAMSKPILVYVYKKMIENNEIENDGQMWKLLRKRPTRNMSGVDVITILMHPYPNGQEFTCEHDCYYCPNEPPTEENGYLPPPRSYLSEEPAVARGLRNGYDEISQVNERITTLITNGHEADKLEYIIEGGTHSEFPFEYLESFHRNIIYAANVYYEKEKREPYSIEIETHLNKNAKIKVIGISVETRPDSIVTSPDWLYHYRRWGVTRIQLGVQHTDNSILKKVNRGHTIETSIEAIQMCKEHGFKVEIHAMLDLPGSSPAQDIGMLQEIFQNENINPDYIKLYPCSVTPWTVIEKWYKEGKYKPYAERNPEDHGFKLKDVMKAGIMFCPPTTRISRVVRDIPTTYIKGGNNIPNLRQIVEKELEESGQEIMCIRYRECGRHPEYKMEDAIYITRDYETQNGKEYFISLESTDEKVIFGFIRLRVPINDVSQFRFLDNKAIVRELHVYGDLVPVGARQKKDTQHRGVGKELLRRAEEIAGFYDKNGVAVISGIGVRGYYEKFGYELVNTYMIKYLNHESDESLRYLGLLGIIYGLILIYSYLYLPSEFVREHFHNMSLCN